MSCCSWSAITGVHLVWMEEQLRGVTCRRGARRNDVHWYQGREDGSSLFRAMAWQIIYKSVIFWSFAETRTVNLLNEYYLPRSRASLRASLDRTNWRESTWPKGARGWSDERWKRSEKGGRVRFQYQISWTLEHCCSSYPTRLTKYYWEKSPPCRLRLTTTKVFILLYYSSCEVATCQPWSRSTCVEMKILARQNKQMAYRAEGLRRWRSTI